jgi:hypothetical protein
LEHIGIVSDHTLAIVSTWTEVAILLFMVWEKYGPPQWTLPMIPLSGSLKFTNTLKALWHNRTLIVAIGGLGFIGWLNFSGASVPPENVAHLQPATPPATQRGAPEMASLRSQLSVVEHEREQRRQELRVAQAQAASLQNGLTKANEEINRLKLNVAGMRPSQPTEADPVVGIDEQIALIKKFPTADRATPSRDILQNE